MYSNPSNSDWSILLMTSLKSVTYEGELEELFYQQHNKLGVRIRRSFPFLFVSVFLYSKIPTLTSRFQYLGTMNYSDMEVHAFYFEVDSIEMKFKPVATTLNVSTLTPKLTRLTKPNTEYLNAVLSSQVLVHCVQ